MPERRYLVTLTEAEREPLEQLLRGGTTATCKVPVHGFCSKPLRAGWTSGLRSVGGWTGDR
jgi:hypothetical protein